MGKVIKISGPLVVATDMPEAKMYDVVKVSRLGLVGEIVELRGDLVYIQVYEETGGIAPGEPVTSTGQPLQVELGPGLVGSIYDGTQRPLDIIRDKTGDYITRGVDLPSIDRKKKWHFTPTIDPGAKVSAGDIIGTVQETPLIVHKIMVPPGIEGVVEEIKEDDFTVEETIAKIREMSVGAGDKRITALTMLQRWPVRKQRPYKEKFPPDEPLSTGQRVIDTFFPVAKGGTACVPGPFGSGKCVSGDTPIILGNGSIIRMKELYQECLKRGMVKMEKDEVFIELNPFFSTLSLNERRIESTLPKAFYKGKSSSLVEIITKSGRKIKVTPLHKLFRLNHVGEIVETEAGEIREGDYILAVRRLSLGVGDAKIDPYQLKEARCLDENIREKISVFLRELKNGGKIKDIGITGCSAESWIYKRTAPPLWVIKRIYDILGEAPPLPTKLRGARWGQVVHIPHYVTDELGEFLGLFIAEGYIRSTNCLVFTNNDVKIQKRYMDLVKSLFNIDTKVTKWRYKAASVNIHNRVLVDFIKIIGADGNSSKKRIPEDILTSSNKVLASFIKGVYLGDGYFHPQKGEIEFCTASKELQLGLSYALTRLGIIHVLREKRVKGKLYYRVFIRNRDELKEFYKVICEDSDTFRKLEIVKDYINSKDYTYTSHDLVPLGPEYVKRIYEDIGCPYAELKQNGIEIFNHITNRENMSITVFKRFMEVLGTRLNGDRGKYKHLFRLNDILKDVFCDRVESVRRIEGDVDVFDICVPGYENFVGGFGGVILHNTVIQHQLAKWSDADIVVYCGCGERGNEMCDVLLSFPQLKDPRSGLPLINRTVMIANTSNMPVAAREASIYTGITIAEYFRDMGYSVALMADSTSRWAEALREMSGRLEELPGEEGYPAYLPVKLAEFYERAGKVQCLSTDNRYGALSVIGAISPPGGDLSDPVVQGTLKVVQVFWSLEDWLAYERHFPAINWLNSYSLYVDNLSGYFKKEIAPDFVELQREGLKILQKEAELKEIARLVGVEALSSQDQLLLLVAKSIREDFLHQNAFHEIDTYTSLKKQYRLLRLILKFYKYAQDSLQKGVDIKKIMELPVLEKIARAKYIHEDRLEEIDLIEKEMGA